MSLAALSPGPLVAANLNLTRNFNLNSLKARASVTIMIKILFKLTLRRHLSQRSAKLS